MHRKQQQNANSFRAIPTHLSIHAFGYKQILTALNRFQRTKFQDKLAKVICKIIHHIQYKDLLKKIIRIPKQTKKLPNFGISLYWV